MDHHTPCAAARRTRRSSFFLLVLLDDRAGLTSSVWAADAAWLRCRPRRRPDDWRLGGVLPMEPEDRLSPPSGCSCGGAFARAPRVDRSPSPSPCRCSPTVAAIETSAGASRTPRDRARRAPRRDARGRPIVPHRRVLRRRFPRVEPAQSPGPPAASSPPRCCTGPCSTWSPETHVPGCSLPPPRGTDYPSRRAETDEGDDRARTSSRAPRSPRLVRRARIGRAPRLLPARARRLCARTGTARLGAGVTKQPRPLPSAKFLATRQHFWHGDRTWRLNPHRGFHVIPNQTG